MSSDSAGKICAYCGKPELGGGEDNEHAVPATINGRFTTRTVCNACNRRAGNEIDQPWLNEPFVLHVRFSHQIPDRRGNTIETDPLLTGMTDDGRRVTLGRDGRPKLINAPVERDPDKGEFRIVAPDQETLDRKIDRELHKGGRRRGEVELPEPQEAEDQPAITGRVETVPARWERMVAKIPLALLSEEQPEAWRTGVSADRLRRRVWGQEPHTAQLRQARSLISFAPEPCTAVSINSIAGGPAAYVSLLGIFEITLPLADDLQGVDLTFVSDPLDPAGSCSGNLAAVVGHRLGAADAA